MGNLPPKNALRASQPSGPRQMCIKPGSRLRSRVQAPENLLHVNPPPIQANWTKTIHLLRRITHRTAQGYEIGLMTQMLHGPYAAALLPNDCPLLISSPTPVRSNQSFRFEYTCTTRPLPSPTVNSTKDQSLSDSRSTSEKFARTVKSPLEGAGDFVAPQSNRATEGRLDKIRPFVVHELDENVSDGSDVPLATKHAKRVRALARARTKLLDGQKDAPRSQKKRRSKAAQRGVEPETVLRTAGHPKVVPDAETPLLPMNGDDSGHGRNRQVLQEKNASTDALRKRKQRVKASVNATVDGENEDEDAREPPRKKSRRADPAANRRRKENRDMSRSAREAATVRIDQPLPSPVKQPAARPKRISKVKPPSRARATQMPRTRGLPPDVLRRIKENARTGPALDDNDDDDPIDFLRSS
ncbi:hypothetical protein F5148DRAFT_31422 [Russula earlei]|uniref:Uncharacterized protein n=1 Tax=Russula earlei TaxID=71964 RepID=A0ACC0UAD7_9AGAM|nr:hypothetical protein F5148DRAFT_31422 [Russula earlei]